MKPFITLIATVSLIAGCGNRWSEAAVYPPGYALPKPSVASSAPLPSLAIRQAAGSAKSTATLSAESASATSRRASAEPKPMRATATPAAASNIPVKPSGKPLQIKLFRSYGSESTIHVRGRVMEADEQKPVNAEDSALTNFWRNLDNLSVDEMPGIKVDVSLQGRTVRLVSDHEGMLLVSTQLFGSHAPGVHELRAEIVPGQGYWAPAAETRIVIQAAQSSKLSLASGGGGSALPQRLLPSRFENLGIVSDIDDTIKVSDVTNKLSAVQRLLFKNQLTAEAIPGTATLYQLLEQLDGQTDGDVHYLSGSPLNLAEMIYGFLDSNAYPRGAVDLKKWGFSKGDDNPIQQQDYKQAKLRTLLKTYPSRQYLFFGDSGEKDPEIYQQISQEFPEQVKAIFINNVTGAKASDARFEGIHLTNSTLEAARILQKMGLLDAAQVNKVQMAL
ncbi:MAG: hypothetical protein CVV27_14505 [Candidatus Melainabacteria bacterium HGW-Melainabacteria-1]|nr:MAG: hypothetical protein CVV27_14505 [Candidatus Melainabacteria bacterium HGW-Melainabacteria-1]